ncbi:CMP-sialic acid transporter 2 [Asimina triloba]
MPYKELFVDSSDRVLQTPFQGWMMAIIMALLSGFAGVYTEVFFLVKSGIIAVYGTFCLLQAIIKKRPSRNINVQNFWLYVFGMVFNAFAIVIQDFDAVINNGIAVSMVMKYADNIVKNTMRLNENNEIVQVQLRSLVYSTSVAMLLTAVAAVFLFGFNLSLAFFLGSTVVSVSIYLHSIGKPLK